MVGLDEEGDWGVWTGDMTVKMDSAGAVDGGGGEGEEKEKDEEGGEGHCVRRVCGVCGMGGAGGGGVGGRDEESSKQANGGWIGLLWSMVDGVLRRVRQDRR